MKKEYFIKMREIDIKEILKIIKVMKKEFFIIKMEMDMKLIIRIIKKRIRCDAL